MVGPRTKRMSSRLANPKYSNPQEEEEDDDSGDTGRRRSAAKRSASNRESTTRKTPARKKSKDQPSVPLPRNELDAPEDGYWDDSGQWVEGPRSASAAGSTGSKQGVSAEPEAPPVLSPIKPGGEDRSSSVGPETPNNPGEHHPDSQQARTFRRKPSGQEALFLPPPPSPTPSVQGNIPMLDYLHLSPPPTQQPFKRQSGRQPRDEYYSEGEPSGDDDVQPPPRRRVRLSPPPLSAPSQASSRVVLGDIPLEDLPSSRRKTYSRRVRHIHRRQREEPAFSPVPRSQVPSFEELMEYQAAQERPPSYPSSGLSFLHSSQPRRIPGTYDDEYDEEDEWTAVLPRPGESARRVWRDRGEEDLSRAQGMSPSWYRRTDRHDMPFTRAFSTSQYHIPALGHYPAGGRLEFNNQPYRRPFPYFEDEECGQIDFTQTTNYYRSKGTATNHKKVSSKTRRSRHVVGRIQPAYLDNIKPIRTVPREDYLEELRLRHEEGADFAYPVDERLQKYTRRAPKPSKPHERLGPRFGGDALSEPVSEFTSSNRPPSDTIRLRALPQTRVGRASNAAPPFSPLKFTRDDNAAQSVNRPTTTQSRTPLPTTSASSPPQDRPQQSPTPTRSLTSGGSRGSKRNSHNLLPLEDHDILREWQDLRPEELPPGPEEDGFDNMPDSEGDLDVDDVQLFEPEPLHEVTQLNNHRDQPTADELDLESIFNLQQYLNDGRSRPSRPSVPSPSRPNREPLVDLTPKPPSGGLSGLGMTDLLLTLATKTVEQDAGHMPPLPSGRKRKLDERKQRLAEKHNPSSSRSTAPPAAEDQVMVPATLEPLKVYRPSIAERPVVVVPATGSRPSAIIPPTTEPPNLPPGMNHQHPQLSKQAAPTTVAHPTQVFDSLVEPPSSQRRSTRSRFAKDPQPQEKYVPLLPSNRNNAAARPPPSVASGSSTNQHATQPAPPGQRARSRTAAPLSAPFKQPTNTNLPPPPPLTAAQRVKARLAASFPSYDEILPKPPPPPPPPALGTRARAKTEYRTSTVTESSTTYRKFKAPNAAE